MIGLCIRLKDVKLEAGEKEFLEKHGFDMIRNEDRLFTSRVNLLLVVESLLFLSFAYFVTLIVYGLTYAQIIVIFGLFMSSIFLFICGRHFYDFEVLKQKYEKAFPAYKLARRSRLMGNYNSKLLRAIFSAHFLLGEVLMLGFIAVWFWFGSLVNLHLFWYLLFLIIYIVVILLVGIDRVYLSN